MAKDVPPPFANGSEKKKRSIKKKKTHWAGPQSLVGLTSGVSE